MDTETIMEMAKSFNEVSLKGMRSGQEIERQRYKFLVEAVRDYIELKKPVISEPDEAFKKMEKALRDLGER